METGGRDGEDKSAREEAYKRVLSQILMELTDTIQRYFNVFLRMKCHRAPGPQLAHSEPATTWLLSGPGGHSVHNTRVTGGWRGVGFTVLS